MTELLSRLGGILFCLTGLAMLAHLDLPVLRHGGLSAAAAGLDLVAATVVVATFITLAARTP